MTYGLECRWRRFRRPGYYRQETDFLPDVETMHLDWTWPELGELDDVVVGL